jgi:hypothetical protein
MNVTFECPNCHNPQRVEWTDAARPIPCPSCDRTVEPKPGSLQDRQLRACIVCGTEDMYVQKDFPHRLGLAVVAAGIVLSSLAWWRYHYPAALGVLLATAALDACLYYLVGDVTVCYRCLAQFRRFQQNPTHRPFDLAIGERYRQERMRLEQLRRSSTS